MTIRQRGERLELGGSRQTSMPETSGSNQSSSTTSGLALGDPD